MARGERVVRKAFSPRIPEQLVCVDVSRTKQSFKDDCDINSIMKKYEKTGVVAHQAKYQGNYADVSGGLDYHASMNAVTRAQEMFMQLPASVRTKFGNDPGRFLEFAMDPANDEEMIKMGLKKENQRAQVVEAVLSAESVAALKEPAAAPPAAPAGAAKS